MTGWIASAVVVSWIGAGCCCCGGGCGDAALEPESRDLAEVTVGGRRLTLRADLLGRRGTEHHGGGRLGWTSESDEEHWRISIALGEEERVPLVPLHGDGWIVWRGDAREDGVAVLDGLEAEPCPDGDGVAVRVAGTDPPRWLSAHAGDGWGFHAPLDSGATDCGSLSSVPSAEEQLQAVRDDALRVLLELAREQERGESGTMDDDGHARTSAGHRACGVHLDRGEGDETLRCLWELRRDARRNDSAVRRAVTLIEEGPGADPDLEAAMFRLASPDVPARPGGPALRERARLHREAVIGSYLSRAVTEDRMRAFVERALETCSGGSCARWRLGTAGGFAHDLSDTASCDRIVDVARRLTGDAPGTALSAIRACSETGSEEALRAALIAGLSRRTMPADARPPTCDEGAIIEGTYRSTVCRSLPRYAGSWLGEHCHPDAVARAHEIVVAIPDADIDPYGDALADGAFRVLSECDREGIVAAMRERGREDLLPEDG